MEGQRASADFVEGRRTALQHYLEQLAAHPVISQSEVHSRCSLHVHKGRQEGQTAWRPVQEGSQCESCDFTAMIATKAAHMHVKKPSEGCETCSGVRCWVKERYKYTGMPCQPVLACCRS